MDLLQGTLNLLVLRSLVGGPKHGYQIARTIKEHSSDALTVEEGALYPALHRLLEKGWVRSEWGLSENKRRARFYELTAEGRRALEAERRSWSRYVAAVDELLDSAPGTIE